jgi:hypothetical protein
MRTRTITAGLAALLLATLAACGNDDSGTPAKPSTTPSSSPTAKAYTYEHCVELLEYDFEKGQPQDVSGEAECSHLTPDQYADAVAEVLTAHKDDILDPTP